MLKIFATVSVIAGLALAFDFQPRVTGGIDAKVGIVKSYVALEVEFDRGIRTCGGLLYYKYDRIITTASCVFDESEGKATTVRLAFGQSNNFTVNRLSVKSIFKHPAYDVSQNTSSGDIAVIMLDGLVQQSASVEGADTSIEARPDAYLGENLFVCGFGVIDNFRNRSKTLQCTTLFVVPSDECRSVILYATTTTTESWFVVPEPHVHLMLKNTICTRNDDSRNVCGGDFGSPVYSNETGVLVPVGIVSFYPDARFNTRCQDGHYVVTTQLGPYKSFIKDPATFLLISSFTAMG